MKRPLPATLTTLFSALGLVLSSVGLYGVMAYMVEQRTGEIGVRMALGADRGRVLRMVLRGAFSQVAIGLAIGIPAAIGAGKLMTQQFIPCTLPFSLPFLARSCQYLIRSGNGGLQ